MAQDILALLKKDHDHVRELFSCLDKLKMNQNEECEETFEHLKRALEVHAKAEEAALYARIEEVDKAKKYALEGAQEHDVIKFLLKKLEDMPIEDWERWRSTLKVLKENVEHHVREEEKELFPLVKKEFNAEEREEMGIHLDDEKHALASQARVSHYEKEEIVNLTV